MIIKYSLLTEVKNILETENIQDRNGKANRYAKDHKIIHFNNFNKLIIKCSNSYNILLRYRVKNMALKPQIYCHVP